MVQDIAANGRRILDSEGDEADARRRFDATQSWLALNRHRVSGITDSLHINDVADQLSHLDKSF
jgi:hypothetical protein